MRKMREMPTYKSHKIVSALMIGSIGPDMIYPERQEFEPIKITPEFKRRCNPYPGGYIVFYEDGYQSFSPADVFEAGYKLVSDPADSKIEAIAQVAHTANKGWCEANGDYSQPSWQDAPEWQKESAMNGVRFHMQNPDAGDSASHDNWLKEKEAAGWVFGLEKDAENKAHPCMVPFDSLPKEQQIKDAIFRSIVHAFIDA